MLVPVTLLLPVVTLLLLSLELMLVPVPVLLVLTMWASLMKFMGPQEGR